MRQQINLYQRTRRAQLPLSAHSLLVASIALIAVLLSIWGYGQFAVSRLQHQVELLQQQQQAQNNLANAARTLYSEKIDSTALLAQVAQLKQSLSERQQALQLLRNLPAASQQGFAIRLQALAHPHIEGVWLEGITLNDQPGIYSLSGRSLNPTLVAGYLRALGSEPALAGTRFSNLSILGPKQVDAKDSLQSSADTSDDANKSSLSGVRFHVDNRVNAATSTNAISGNAT